MKDARPEISGPVYALAGYIAKTVHENWCGWAYKTGCIRFRIATTERDEHGDRIWVLIGGCTVEFLELLVEMDYASRARSVARQVRQLQDFIEKQGYSVPN